MYIFDIHFSDVTKESYGRVSGIFHPKYNFNWQQMRDGRQGEDSSIVSNDDDMDTNITFHRGPRAFFGDPTNQFAFTSASVDNASLQVLGKIALLLTKWYLLPLQQMFSRL